MSIIRAMPHVFAFLVASDFVLHGVVVNILTRNARVGCIAFRHISGLRAANAVVYRLN